VRPQILVRAEAVNVLQLLRQLLRQNPG
jgi:hypothetical protein